MEVIKRFKIEDHSRVFFVSDLHGEINSLLIALEKLKFDSEKDFLFSAGDLIDRGPESYKTACHFLADKTGAFHSVRGNHDQFAIETPKSNIVWTMNGGEWATQSMSFDELENFGDAMSKLPYVFEIEYKGSKVGVVHADVPPEYDSWEKFLQAIQENPEARTRALWSRDILYGRTSNDFQNTLLGIDHTIHGHTVVSSPNVIGNRHYIDTGHVFGQYLTIVEYLGGDSFVYYRIDHEGKLSLFEEWDLEIDL